MPRKKTKFKLGDRVMPSWGIASRVTLIETLSSDGEQMYGVMQEDGKGGGIDRESTMTLLPEPSPAAEDGSA